MAEGMQPAATVGTPVAPPPRPPAKTPPRRLLGAAGLVAALVLAVAVNVLAERFLGTVRIDLTEQRLYTLSEGTRTVLRGIEEPITLRLYYSERLGREIPLYAGLATRVREFLREYAALSQGKIRLEFYEPEPFSEVEDRALAFGLQGVPIDQSGEQVFFGLAGTNTLDDERTIPFFQPERERFLEADLTRLVYELSNPRRPVVGVMTGLPVNGEMRGMGGRPTPPWVVMTQMRQFLQVKEVPLDAAEIDAEIGVLLVAHPQNLSDRAQYAIDQFVMRGGRLMLLLDPHSEAQAFRPDPRGRPMGDTSSDLPRLLSAWGIEYDRTQVAADLRGAFRVRANPGERVQAVDYVAWFAASGPEQIARGDVVTGDLNQIAFGSPGFLRRRAGAGGEFIPLVTTSTEAAAIPAEQVRTDPNPSAILAAFRPGGERLVLAARLRGELPSAFPDGPPAPAEGEEPPARREAHRARSAGNANLVIVADSDILEDRFWVRVQDFFGQQVAQPTADNGAFVVNALDNLAGSDALIGLRSRGESRRPFELVERMRRQAEASYRATEQALTKKLEETERRLRELRQGGATPAERGRAEAVLTAEQRAAIEDARRVILETRQELRAVQRDLRRDIETLEARVKVAAIVAVPLVVAVVAVLLGLWRIRRRARRAEEPLAGVAA